MNFFIEAEWFKTLGGWIIDSQCTAAMGSPYLMAHGIGHPVPDASTPVTLPEPARWHAWVRTRNWTAVWKRGTPAGQFQLTVDGTPLPEILGTRSGQWAWQSAGSFRTTSKNQTVSLALHDLTGFNGRADAVYLTDDPEDIPPDTPEELDAFRQTHTPQSRITDDPVPYDLIVVGGGYAGICTALAARAHGLRILLIHDRDVLGGCGSSEVRVWTGGRTHIGDYPALGNIAAAISPIDGHPGQRKTAEMFEDHRKKQLFTPGKDLLLNELMTGAECAPGTRRITAVITRNIRTGTVTRRTAPLFADCTGDATLARLADCETRYGREGTDDFNESLAPRQPDREVMGHSVLWEPRTDPYPVPFPDIDWGLEFNDQNGLKRFNCCWDWECGQHRNQVTECEFIRDYGLMTVIANWSWLKNRSPYREEAATLALEWLSPIGGKRESYRVIGDHVITQNDIENKTPYPDSTAAITWSIDLHLPDPQNAETFGEAFQSCAYHRGISTPYGVPYRCLYARDAENLFLGGRIISATHVAFSAIRVMRTLGMLGEVAGMAAALCKKHTCTPRDIYTDHLDELKAHMTAGIEVPQPCGYLPGPPTSLYHFMRPVGSLGNPGEDIWITCDQTGTPPPGYPETYPGRHHQAGRPARLTYPLHSMRSPARTV